MKLFDTLKILILEQQNPGVLLFITPEFDSFYASKHQTIDRLGNRPFRVIRDIILKALDTPSSTHTRVAVPNTILSSVIEDNYEKILESINSNLEYDRYKFVYEDQENEDEDIFSFIEFIIEKSKKKNKEYNIVSSTYSEDGGYLKVFKQDGPKQKKIYLENYFHSITILL